MTIQELIDGLAVAKEREDFLSFPVAGANSHWEGPQILSFWPSAILAFARIDCLGPGCSLFQDWLFGLIMLEHELLTRSLFFWDQLCPI